MITPSLPAELLNDLCARFIINIPEHERNDLVRLCFQVELAHWFFIDRYANEASEYQSLQNIRFKDFTIAIFKHVPFLRPHLSNIDTVLLNWKGYKNTVPTFGGILLDETLTHVLLVQGFSSKGWWSFPKGKVNEEEEPVKCAIREIEEEVGFNCEAIIDPNEYIETSLNDHTTRLYIIPNVPFNTKFQTQTKNEIRHIRWHSLEEIRFVKKDTDKNAPNYYAVYPFMRKLQVWIDRYMEKRRRNRTVSAGDRSCNIPISFGRKPVLPSEGERLRDDKSMHRGSPPVKKSQPTGQQTPGKSTVRKGKEQQGSFKFFLLCYL
ncbi:hypothetical protein QYM36_006069 [Artemia franciscana]|uniref:mRNA-decapping enzyme 2 n=1 Tax=Artemia franciscana TaxID=6661 RepID=A0AA88HXH6_ARTSF|nr:hypothetical protein QYM36_006069 [Artemia franciscana]